MEKIRHLTSKRHHIPKGLSSLPGLIRSETIQELSPLIDNRLSALITTTADDFPKKETFRARYVETDLVQSTLHIGT